MEGLSKNIRKGKTTLWYSLCSAGTSTGAKSFGNEVLCPYCSGCRTNARNLTLYIQFTSTTQSLVLSVLRLRKMAPLSYLYDWFGTTVPGGWLWKVLRHLHKTMKIFFQQSLKIFKLFPKAFYTMRWPCCFPSTQRIFAIVWDSHIVYWIIDDVISSSNIIFIASFHS